MDKRGLWLNLATELAKIKGVLLLPLSNNFLTNYQVIRYKDSFQKKKPQQQLLYSTKKQTIQAKILSKEKVLKLEDMRKVFYLD